jgi:heme/copper-type cytochrome/quinol oxidase subunit 2
VRGRVAGTTVVAAVLIAAVFFYVVDFLTVSPPALSATMQNGTAHLTLQTVPSYGHAPEPDWVSYLARDASGQWHHTTIFKLPAHTLVTVTLYQYDTPSGLRNPFIGQIRGTTGGIAIMDGKPVHVLNPNDASHTFTVPDLGISVPLPGVNPNAKNQCSVAPCSLSEAHTTIQFSFRTPGPGTYRWQCFVPCAAGFYFGNGGPMQTIGWMSGELQVS